MDAGTEVQTGSSEIASHVKKVKRKPTPDDDDNKEEKNTHAGQEATPKKSNCGPGTEIMPKKLPTGEEHSHVEGSKPG